MKEPQYQEIKKDKIPVYIHDVSNSQVTIIAGEFEGLTGPCKSTTQSSFFDVRMQLNSEFVFEISQDKSGFIYLFEGDNLVISDSNKINCYTAASFYSERRGSIKFNTNMVMCRFLLVFGNPIREPVCKYGPFVMNTQVEIERTFDDYRNHKNGFQNAKNWRSEIRDLGN